jgi:hypothetical protein
LFLTFDQPSEQLMYLGIGSLLDLKSALLAQNYPIQNDKNQTSELFQYFP